MNAPARRGLILALLVAAATAACGGASAPLPVSDVSGVRLAVAWRVTSTDVGHFPHRIRELGGVAFGGRMIVATTASGRVMGVDADSGDVRWTVDIGEPLSAAPVIADGVVYVAGPDGRVRALDLSGGTERWSHRASTSYSSPVTVTEDFVYACGGDATLRALDRVTGQLRWRYERPPATDLTMLGDCRPVEADASVFAGFHDGSLARVDTAGQTLWLRDLSRGRRRLADVDGRPLVLDDLVIAASFRGGIFAWRRSDGAPVWDADIEGASSPWLVGDEVVVGTADGQVVWLDLADGSVVRSLELGGGAVGEMVPFGPYLVVPTAQGGLYVVDADAAWIHGRFAPDSGFSSAVAVGGHRVFALSDGGYLYALEMQSL